MQLQLLQQPQLHRRASVHHQMPTVQAQHLNLSLQAHRSMCSLASLEYSSDYHSWLWQLQLQEQQPSRALKPF